MSIADNINRVKDQMAASCARVNRDPSEVTLVAVSKGKTEAAIVEAAAAGIQHFGENRVEEGMQKIETVNASVDRPVTWHMVGHVQSRKAKHVVPNFDVIQSVDSLRLATRLARFARLEERELRVMLEINVSGEASKYGFEGYNWYRNGEVRERLWQDVRDIVTLSPLRVIGLMTMAPYNAEEETIREVFAELRSLRQELTRSLTIDLPELSMGMTNDYPIAIEEGATLVRIGRAIFGERQA